MAKEVLKEINLNNFKFRIANFMSDWVRIINPKGEIIFVNHEMKEAFHIDPTGINLWEDTFDEDLIPRSVTTRDFQFMGMIKEERFINASYYSVQASPIIIEGDYLGSVEVFRDITAEILLRNDLMKTNEKINRDLHFAREIQRNILPQRGIYGDLSISYRYISSEALSGDIFDVIVIDEHRVAIYIADIVGHGVAASFLTMFVRQTMRSLIQDQFIYPNDILQELKVRYNDLRLDDDKYFTMFYGVYDSNKGTFTCANAGHNAIPIKFNSDFSLMVESSGFPISYVFLDSVYLEKKINLHPGDKILFYTDGITETKNRQEEEFGEERLRRIVKENRNRVLDDIIEAIEWFRFGEQEDDLCLLLMEVTGKNKG